MGPGHPGAGQDGDFLRGIEDIRGLGSSATLGKIREAVRGPARVGSLASA